MANKSFGSSKYHLNVLMGAIGMNIKERKEHTLENVWDRLPAWIGTLGKPHWCWAFHNMVLKFDPIRLEGYETNSQCSSRLEQHIDHSAHFLTLNVSLKLDLSFVCHRNDKVVGVLDSDIFPNIMLDLSLAGGRYTLKEQNLYLFAICNQPRSWSGFAEKISGYRLGTACYTILCLCWNQNYQVTSLIP